MRLPQMPYADNITKSKQVNFGGLNHRIGARDGELWDMENLTAEEYPVMATRKNRLILDHLDKPNGVFFWEKLCWVDGTGFFWDGWMRGVVQDSMKTFTAIGHYILIFPDKKYYNYETDTFGSLEADWSDTSVHFMNDTLYGVPAVANTIYRVGANWADSFRVGDAVTISGCADHPENNLTLIVREIEGDKLRFYENSFKIDEGETSYMESGRIRVERRLPDLQFVFEHDNRIWGAAKNVIYASALGDPFNFNVYDGLSTDAWASQIGTPTNEITGAISYGGYPVFFTEERVYKVYGKYPSAFQSQITDSYGVLKGCERSMAIAGNVLYFLSPSGMCAYAGGVPTLIHGPFGDERFAASVAASDGTRYYASMTRERDGWTRTYVYDTRFRLWHIERGMFIDAATISGDIMFLREDGQFFKSLVNPNAYRPVYAVEDGPFDWYAEFADFYGYTTYKGSGTPMPQHKGISKLQLRLELDEDAQAQILIQYDSDGEWVKVSDLHGERKQNHYLAVVPRRCDHFRLRLEGRGGMRLYSLAYDYYPGSDLNTHRGG